VQVGERRCQDRERKAENLALWTYVYVHTRTLTIIIHVVFWTALLQADYKTKTVGETVTVASRSLSISSRDGKLER